MHGIGGNITAEFKINLPTKNEIGENIASWVSIQSLNGWLDYLSGETSRSNYNAKIEESTHIFVCDYVDLDPRIETEKVIMVINNKTYDVTLIDNPMGLNAQLEIYLKYVGGQI